MTDYTFFAQAEGGRMRKHLKELLLNLPFLPRSEMLHRASAQSHVGLVRTFIEAGAKVNSRNSKGDISLSLASQSGNVHTARLLLINGANIMSSNKEGETALHKACYRGISGDQQLEVVQLLLDSGAPVDTPTNDGRTPLHIACACATNVVVQLLLDNGADLAALDSSGETPLHKINNRLPGMGPIDFRKKEKQS